MKNTEIYRHVYDKLGCLVVSVYQGRKKGRIVFWNGDFSYSAKFKDCKIFIHNGDRGIYVFFKKGCLVFSEGGNSDCRFGNFLHKKVKSARRRARMFVTNHHFDNMKDALRYARVEYINYSSPQTWLCITKENVDSVIRQLQGR